ncbi:hypothetical protein QQF64_010500 [Cirrhinus molitorella]|uniref:Uncharacterized protein n=1 Tax=Cirrhinus molitorella TaxID=172907 RepID=A0ABR3M892_9TELE
MEETQMEASQSLNESRVSHASGFLVRAAQRGACAGDGDAGTPGVTLKLSRSYSSRQERMHYVCTSR